MKVIVITGASSGIGLSIAQYLCSKGHKVYGISRTKVHEKNIKSIQADVTNVDQLIEAYQEIFDIEGHIDVLINNAGMGISGSIEDTSSEDASYLMNVNFMGVFNSTKIMLPFMRESGGGKIFNMSSVAAKLSIPFQAFYSSSKAAINSFSEALANEVAPFNIQVCSIMPGDIKTGFTKNRKKNDIDSPVYGERVEKSVSVMEKDEQNGMKAETVANAMVMQVMNKNMKTVVIPGIQYQAICWLFNRLPTSVSLWIVGKIYG